MKRARLTAFVVAAVALLGGCKATHLIYAYDLSVGIDMAYSTEGNGRMVFGYDRGTYAIVPQRQDESVAGECQADGPSSDPGLGETGELMSLAATSRVVSAGITDFKFQHFISTGNAAVKLAKKPEALQAARTAILGN